MRGRSKTIKHPIRKEKLTLSAVHPGRIAYQDLLVFDSGRGRCRLSRVLRPSCLVGPYLCLGPKRMRHRGANKGISSHLDFLWMKFDSSGSRAEDGKIIKLVPSLLQADGDPHMSNLRSVYEYLFKRFDLANSTCVCCAMVLLATIGQRVNHMRSGEDIMHC